jgi:hypothetical protein
VYTLCSVTIMSHYIVFENLKFVQATTTSVCYHRETGPLQLLFSLQGKQWVILPLKIHFLIFFKILNFFNVWSGFHSLSCDGRESELLLLPPKWCNQPQPRPKPQFKHALLIIFGFVQVPFITNTVTLPCQLTIIYKRYLKLIHHLII